MVDLRGGDSLCVRARRKLSIRKKMAKLPSSWLRVGNAALKKLSIRVHRKESENAMQDKTPVEDE